MRLLAGTGAALTLGACRGRDWYGVGVTGTLPDLAFTMTRASDGQTVTAADFRGQVVMLFFGFTSCEDVCPLTMANLAATVDALGDDAQDVTVLMVTVDPLRDTAAVLSDYVANFTDRATGLRGDANRLAALARRYKVTYKIMPHAEGEPYMVSHGKSVYVFDRDGEARVMWPAFDSFDVDIEAAARDLQAIL